MRNILCCLIIVVVLFPLTAPAVDRKRGDVGDDKSSDR